MRLIIHGVSSWIGYYLVSALSKTRPSTEVVGLYRNTIPILKTKIKCLSSKNFDDVKRFTDDFRPTAIINLARGEDEEAFALHQYFINFSNTNDGYYSFASSANAVDANYLNFHDEEELPNAQTDYGKYKAKCEMELRESSKRFSILRFSAVHGWSPYGERRTETFLRELKDKGQVVATVGVFQNQIAVTDLGEMIACVLLRQGQGTFHLGPVDYLEHIDFLRKLAIGFGYNSTQIIDGEKKPFNLVVTPRRITAFDGSFKKSVLDTVRSVIGTPEFEIYKLKIED